MKDGLARARIITLLGSVLTALSSGTNYVYSAYAPQLGSRLHVTHTQLNIIGLSGNMGMYTTGPLFGRIVDRRGPRPLLIASFILLLVGYTGLRRYYDTGPSGDDEILPSLSLVMLSIFSYMTGAGGHAGLTAASNSTAKSFPERMRATTVGLVLSGFGLSAFFFSTLSHWFFHGNTSSFLHFLSFGTSLPIIIGFFTIRAVPHAERFNTSSGGFIYSDSDAIESSSHRFDQDINRAVIDGRYTSDTHNGLSGEDVGMNENSSDATRGNAGSYHELTSAVDISHPRSPSREVAISTTYHGAGGCSSRRTAPVARSNPFNVHGKRMLTGWEFWLLFAILSLLSGTGLMYINNVGSIAQALSAKGNPDYDKLAAGKLQAAQVSIISLANCGARFGIGASADFIKSRFGAHRSYLLTLISILFITSQIVGSIIDDVDRLWLTSLILGLGYGGIFGLLPTITIEWFGMAHFSENWGFVSLAPLIGGNTFSLLFGRNFDAHVPRSIPKSVSPDISPAPHSLRFRTSILGHKLQCLEGRDCYSATLTVTTLACALALILSLIAAWRDRRKRGEYETLPQEVIWQDTDE